jgi:hypothetical protein
MSTPGRFASLSILKSSRDTAVSAINFLSGEIVLMLGGAVRALLDVVVADDSNIFRDADPAPEHS